MRIENVVQNSLMDGGRAASWKPFNILSERVH